MMNRTVLFTRKRMVQLLSLHVKDTKCGFVRVGEEKPVNEAMTLIDYERAADDH